MSMHAGFHLLRPPSRCLRYLPVFLPFPFFPLLSRARLSSPSGKNKKIKNNKTPHQITQFIVMESLCGSSLHPNSSPFSCSLRPVPITTPKPFFPRVTPIKPSLKPSFPLRRTVAVKSEPSSTPVVYLLKPLSLAVATAAASFAVLLSRFPSVSPSLALAAAVSAPSSPVSDSLTEPQPEPDNDRIVAALRLEVEEKIEKGDFAGSIKTLDRLISLQPGNSDLYLLKAHLQSHLGDVSSARRSFESILEKDPFLVEAYHGLIVTTSNSGNAQADAELRAMMKRVESTIELCKKEKDSKEKVRDFQLLLAQIKVILGEYEESLRVYGEMEKEEPTDFRPYLCKGIVYTLLKKKEEADGQFEKYKRLVPQGHPYEKFFDEMVGMKIFGEMQEAKKGGSLNN